MNRRMRRELARAKFEAARQRALARLGEQWSQLQERLRGEDLLTPRQASMLQHLGKHAGTGRVLIVGPGGITTDLGIKGISFVLGHRTVPHQAQERDDLAAREREFVETAMRSGISPSDPWPCFDCSVEILTERLEDGRHHQRKGRTRTCDKCRALGAPEYLP